jgi:hypothetical protein
MLIYNYGNWGLSLNFAFHLFQMINPIFSVNSGVTTVFSSTQSLDVSNNSLCISQLTVDRWHWQSVQSALCDELLTDPDIGVCFWDKAHLDTWLISISYHQLALYFFTSFALFSVGTVLLYIFCLILIWYSIYLHLLPCFNVALYLFTSFALF